MQQLWQLLSGTTVCYIWKAQCSTNFYQVCVSLVEVASKILLDIIHVL